MAIIGIQKIMRLTGADYSEAILLTQRPDFPRHKVITERLAGWDEDQVHSWILNQLCGNKKPRTKRNNRKGQSKRRRRG